MKFSPKVSKTPGKGTVFNTYTDLVLKVSLNFFLQKKCSPKANENIYNK